MCSIEGEERVRMKVRESKSREIWKVRTFLETIRGRRSKPQERQRDSESEGQVQEEAEAVFRFWTRGRILRAGSH